MVIYKITNIENNKCYIGQTANKNPNFYIKNHFKRANKGEAIGKKYLYDAIRKYSQENFIWEIIDYAKTKKELDEKEIDWIWFYNSNDGKYGYNLTAGGEGSLNCNPWNKGKTKENDKRLLNLSEKLTGLKRSKETCENISKNHSDTSGENNPMYGRCAYDIWVKKYGEEIANIKQNNSIEKFRKTMQDHPKKGMKNKHHTKEAKEKQSMAHKNKPFTEEHKRNIGLGGKGRIFTKEQKEKFSGKNHYAYVDIDINKILELRNEGYTIKKISEALNVGVMVIKSRLRNPEKYK
jgi:hypothetical protein